MQYPGTIPFPDTPLKDLVAVLDIEGDLYNFFQTMSIIVLDHSHPDNNIACDRLCTLFMIDPYNGKSKIDHKLCDWIASIFLQLPSNNKFVINLKNEKMSFRKWYPETAQTLDVLLDQPFSKIPKIKKKVRGPYEKTRVNHEAIEKVYNKMLSEALNEVWDGKAKKARNINSDELYDRIVFLKKTGKSNIKLVKTRTLNTIIANAREKGKFAKFAKS